MKKIPILLLFVTTLLIGFNSCETEPLEGDFEIADTTGGDDTTDDGDGDGSTTYEFMNAIIDGAIYNNMKPFVFNFGSDTAVLIVTHDEGETYYLKIQGGFYLDVGLLGEPGEREINIFILEDHWAEGTYVLDNSSTNIDGENVDYLTVIYFDGTTDSTYNLSGTLTITEFNIVDKVIRGTFDYTFNRVEDVTGNVNGPLEVTGDFEYPLNASYFD